MTLVIVDVASIVAMTKTRQDFGLLGERIAARWLVRQGWSVIDHRFRAGRRDIDLVVRRADEVAFVEVKARKGGSFGGPIEAVHRRKQRELGRAARVWVDRFGKEELAYRFDVVGILVEGENVRVRYVPNAFPLAAK
ncbi:MAG: YraN family protein [Gemmatimonadaceae bacterium]